jgi:hypothetical protein
LPTWSAATCRHVIPLLQQQRAVRLESRSEPHSLCPR